MVLYISNVLILMNMRDTKMKYIFTLVLTVLFSDIACADGSAITDENFHISSTHPVCVVSAEQGMMVDAERMTTAQQVLHRDWDAAQEYIRGNSMLASYALGKELVSFVTTRSPEDAFDQVFMVVASLCLQAVVPAISTIPESLTGLTVSHLQGLVPDCHPVIAKSGGAFLKTFVSKIKDWATNTVASKAVKAFKEGWSGSTESETGSFSSLKCVASSCKGLWDKAKTATVGAIRRTVKTIAPAYAAARGMVA